MTENEAIKRVEEFGLHHAIDDLPHSTLTVKAFKTAITALEEIQRYREIGTVEECREGREKQKPKMSDIWGDGYDNEGNMIYDMYTCPNCGENYEIDSQKYKYCPECGQAIDWSDLE